MKQLLKVILSVLILGVLGCGGSGGDSETATALDANSKNACGVIGLPRIINGESCGGLAASSVVRVMAAVTNGEHVVLEPICTGTLITPDVVLTAAHCFKSELGGFPVVGYGIYIGEPGAGQFYRGVAASAPPTYHFNAEIGRAFDDAGLIRLEAPVPVPVMPLLVSRIPIIGEPGFVYGYGARLEGDTPEGRDFYTLESGAMTIQNVSQNHIFVSFNGEGVNVCNGDSGGPIIVQVNGQPALAGVTSQGSATGCTAGDVSTFTNIHSPGVFDWLFTLVPNAYVRDGS